MVSVPVTISGVGLIFVQQVRHHYGQRLKPGRIRGCEECVRDREAPLSDSVERGSNALAGGGWVEARTFQQALGRLPHPWFGDRVVWSLSCRSRAT